MKTPLLLMALRHSLLLFLLALGLSTYTSHAQTPQYMTYQGYLTDGNGNALGNTNTGPKAYSVVFRVWSAPTSGTEYYGELQTVTVDNGFFSVLLGQGTAYSSEPHGTLSSVFATNPASAYIEMTVLGIGSSGANVTILPRLQLVSTPYAFVAGSANSLVNSSGTPLLSSSGSSVYVSSLTVTNLFAATLSSFNTTNLTAAAVTAGVVTATNANVVNLNVGSIQVTNNFALLNGSINAATLNATGVANDSRLQVTNVLDLDPNGNESIANNNSGNNNYDIRFGGPSAGEGIYCSRVSGGVNQYGITFSTDFNNRMVIQQTGAIGIGTASPVNGWVDIENSLTASFGADAYYGYDLNSGTGATSGAGSAGSAAVSLYATAAIHANEFRAFSDERIKNVIGQSDGVADLKTIQDIKITDFTYKDPQKGAGPQKKVIAQQVEKVYPQAVSRTTDVIPDIFKMADIKDGWVQLATDLKVGDQVRMISESAAALHKVLAVRPGAFLTDYRPASGKAFVYGRQVNDFRVVDYEAIAMLNVSATQELAKRLFQVEAQEARMAALEQKAAEVASLEEQVADLKKMVGQLAEAAKTSKLTAAAEDDQAKALTTASLVH